MKFINKIIYFFKRPPIIITSDNRVFKELLPVIFKKELIFDFDNSRNIISFLIKNSKDPIIILNDKKEIEDIILFKKCKFVLNGEFFRKKEEFPNIITYGSRSDSDFFVSDININEEEINFKITYMGSSVPFWIKGKFDQSDIEVISGIIAVLSLKGMNLVEISEKIKV